MKHKHQQLEPPIQAVAKVPRQPLYFLMLFIGIVSALWLHGHPTYTITLMVLTVICCGAGYLPERMFPLRLRLAMMILFVFAAIGWGTLRFMQKAPVDKILIESICLLALSFSFSPRRQDYGYMLLISGLLLLYGALLPRGIYLVLVPLAFFLTVLILCGSRTAGISGEHDLKPVSPFKFCWGKIVLQALLVATLWVTFYFWMPQEESVRHGFFFTSFKTQNDSILPPDLNSWFRPPRTRISEQGTIFSNKAKNPKSSGQSGSPVQTKTPSGMKSSGNGSSPPGKDLVFIARSPVKLYWVGQLYDHYDGVAWQCSEDLRQQRVLKKTEAASRLIQQDITIEKWISPVLYAAYRADFCTVDTKNIENVEGNFYQYRFKEGVTQPTPPFSYTISSEIDNTNVVRRRQHQWLERVKRERYLQLPPHLISKRLQALTNRLTAGINDDYAKVIVIRDYLRNTFKYKQMSQSPPEGRESVDFFIFELKEGHCEYFAAAMTVMTRLAKIPARVVTGFSPGNYNVLTKCFEVYEYHGHAWSQVYIPRYGWLTLDATPPGAVESRATPMLIGALRDPFGNEWRVRPPELADKVQERSTPEWMSGSTIKDDEDSVLDQALYEAVMLPENIGRAITGAMNKTDRKANDFALFKLLKKVGENFWNECKRIWFALQRHGVNMLVWVKLHTAISIAFLAVLAILLAGLYFLADSLRRSYIRFSCRRLLRGAQDFRESNPVNAIRMIYLVARRTLQMAGIPRQRNMDLFDYAAGLRRIDFTAGQAAMTIFFLYSKVEYGQLQPNSSHVDDAINAAQELLVAAPRLKQELPPGSSQIPPVPDNDRNLFPPHDAML